MKNFKEDYKAVDGIYMYGVFNFIGCLFLGIIIAYGAIKLEYIPVGIISFIVLLFIGIFKLTLFNYISIFFRNLVDVNKNTYLTNKIMAEYIKEKEKK